MSSVLCDLWSDCTCENVACWCICPHERQVGLFTSHHLSSSVQCNGQVFFSSGAPFHDDVPSKFFALPSLQGCVVRDAFFPRFTAPYAMADFEMAVVSVPQCRNEMVRGGIRLWEVCWARPSGSKSVLARCRFFLKILTICLIKPSSSQPSFTVSVETNDAVVPGTCQHLPGDL